MSDNKSKAMMAKLQRITNKNNCFDVFQNTKINDQRVYPEKPVVGLVNFKIKKLNKESEYRKLKLIRGVGCFNNGLTFIEVLLQQIKLAKELFLLNIAQGDEVIIPQELCQRKLPLSYRFYDPIMRLVQQDLNGNMKQFFQQQRKFTVERIMQEDVSRKVLEDLGIIIPYD